MAPAISVDNKDVSLTPLDLLRALGGFDFDPCGIVSHPTAAEINQLPSDGLSVEWIGRVWVNPPYSDPGPWLQKLAAHGDGVALVLSSTDTTNSGLDGHLTILKEAA